MGDKPNGTKPPRQPTQIDAFVRASAAHILGELRVLYPLHRDLDKIAVGIAQEQINLQPLLESMNDPKMTHWQLALYRPSTIDPTAPPHGVKFLAPKRIENCKSEEEALQSITVYGLLSNPAARAVLALHGYKLQISSVRVESKPRLVTEDS